MRWRVARLLILLAWVEGIEIPRTSQLFRNVSSSLNQSWEDSVKKLCASAATTFNVQNTARVMACYNVAALDEVNGLFAGDVRLYSTAPSQLGGGASIRLNVDFGAFAMIQSPLQSASGAQIIQKRSPGIIQDILAARRQQQQNKQQTATTPGTKYVTKVCF